ncbi:MAG: hypothetical protein HC892_03110 [Saprospiraceae bacterium]|nr:hypothetical protein [Saprospiraceae bacterium]
MVLDLHTTSASGGIFTITSDVEQNIRTATKLHAPVVLGMLDGLQGTTLHFFTSEQFQLDTIAISLEAGQHNDPNSVGRAISALINCMRTIGCVQANQVESKHDEILKSYSRHLPKVVELRYVHRIQPNDQFVMRPGYVNFQPIQKGKYWRKTVMAASELRKMVLFLCHFIKNREKTDFLWSKKCHESPFRALPQFR